MCQNAPAISDQVEYVMLKVLKGLTYSYKLVVKLIWLSPTDQNSQFSPVLKLFGILNITFLMLNSSIIIF